MAEQFIPYRYDLLTETGKYAKDLNTLKDTLSSSWTLDTINSALESMDTSTLREISNYYYVVSGEYRRMVDYLANIHTYRHVVSPVMLDTNVEMTNFQKAHSTIMDYCSKAYIESTCAYIAQQVIRMGAFYGYERTMSDGSIVLQELPIAYCRSNYLINGVYAIEFNMKYFDTFRSADDKLKIFNAMPDEFLTLYNEYKANPSGTDANWKMLDEQYARCHKLDNAETPLLCAVFPELFNLGEYKALQKLQSELELYTVVVQKLPFDEDKGVLVHETEAQQLHKNAKNMISGDGIDVFTTPCEIDTISVRNSQDTGRSKVDDALNIVYNTSGTAQVLFNSAKGTGSTGVDRGLRVDESLLTPLINQCERWYNNKFNYLVTSKNFNFFIQFLGVTIFNEKDKVAMYKELATLGYSKLAPAVASGIKQSSFINMIDYENTLLGLNEKMIPLGSSYTQSSSDREEAVEEVTNLEEDKEIQPATEEAKDNEVDVERGKVANE